MFGFASNNADVIFYGSNLKLYYVSDITKYNAVTYDKYGLSLIYTGGGTPENIVNDYNFRTRIGTWVFISLAYYYDVAVYASYPPMLNFMINENNLQISSSALLTGYDIKNFRLPRTTYCLFANLTVFSKYLIGAYGVVNNNTDFSSIPSAIWAQHFIPGSSITNCVITSALSGYWAVPVVCYADFEQYFFPLPLISAKNFKKYAINTTPVQTPCLANASGVNYCSNGCYWNTNDGFNNNNYSCWCFMNNSYVSMILRNNYKNICYRIILT